MPSPPTEVQGTLLERFRSYLRDRRLPVTRQRMLVAGALVRVADHPSVERIEQSLAEQGVHVGTATIYRTIDLLVESGLVREHDFGEGFRRFESVQEHAHHEHLICQRCGRVAEFTNDRLERMLEMIADEMEFLPRRHRIEVYGLCAGCRSRDLAALRPGGIP
jgi:Fur family transcriptional regulator, ferric uptake regulator